MVAPGVGMVTVTWDGGAATGYEYSTDGTTWMPVSAYPLVISGPAGTAISVQIRMAVSGTTPAGMSSTAMSGTPQVDPSVPPVAPTNVMVAPGVGMVTVTWDGGAATGYEYSTDGTTWMPVSAYPLVISGPAGTAISVQIRMAASGTTPAGMSSTAMSGTPMVDPSLRFDGTVANQTFTAGTPIGTTAMPYVQLPVAAGGSGTYTYTLHEGVGKQDITSTGSNGLSVNLSSLRLSGTPLRSDTTGTMYTWRVNDGQNSAELSFTITVNAAQTTPNQAPVLTVSTSAPTAAVTTRTFSIAYATTDANTGDTVTVSASHTVVPSSAAASYTVSTPANGMVTITQAAATATTPNIPAAVVSVTLTANDGTVNSAPVTLAVEFAAGTYTAPPTKPTVTIKAAAGATHTAPFDVTFTFSKMVSLSAGHIVVANGRVADGSVVRAHTKATDAGKVWQATIVPYASATSVTVNVNAAIATAAAALQVPATITPHPVPVRAEGSVVLSGSIATNGFVVLAPAVTGTDDSGLNRNITTIVSGLNVDLERFFINGGRINLIAPVGSTAKVSDVVISEIMWGSDDAATPASESQWIEFYNTTGGAVSLANWVVEFLGPRSVSQQPGTVIDTVTNYGPTGFWQVLGHSGRSSSVVRGNVSLPIIDIVSMYRNIDYDKVEKTDHDTTDAAKNRAEQLKGVPDGRKVGSWKAAVRPSLNILGLYQVGTPGAKHYTRLPSDPSVLTQNVIINEVGNGSGDENDWVELLNTTTSEINLKNWELSIVTLDADGNHSDKALVTFPDNDNTKLPASGILLIANTSPADSANDLAAGTEINIKATDQVKRGVSSLYYVASGLKLAGFRQVATRSAKC